MVKRKRGDDDSTITALDTMDLSMSQPMKVARRGKEAWPETRTPLQDKNSSTRPGKITNRFGFVAKGDKQSNKENRCPDSDVLVLDCAPKAAPPSAKKPSLSSAELKTALLKAELFDEVVKEHEAVRDDIKSKKIGKKSTATKTNMAIVVDQRAKLYGVGRKIFEAINTFSTEVASMEQGWKAESEEMQATLASTTLTLEATAAQLNEQLVDTNAKLSDAQAKNSELKTEVLAISEAHGQIVVEKAKVDECYEAANASIESLHEDLEKKRVDLETTEAQFVAMKTKASADMEMHMAEMARVHANYTQKSDMETAKHESELITLNNDLEAEKEKVRELSERRGDLESQLASLHAESAQYKEKFKNAEELASSKASEVDDLKEKLALKEQENAKAMETFNRVQQFSEERTNVLAAEKEKMERQIETTVAEQQRLTSDLRNAEEAMRVQETELASTKALLEEATQSGKLRETEVAQLTAKLEAEATVWERTKETLEAENSALTEQNRTLLEEHTKQVEESATAHLAEVVALKQEMVDTLASATSERDIKIADLEEKNGVLNKEAQVAQQELNTFKKHCGVSNEKQLENLVALSIEAEELREKLKEHDAVLLQLEHAKAQANELAKAACEAELMRRAMHNKLQEMRGNIRVVARVRPFLPGDNGSDPAATPLEVNADGQSLLIDHSGKKNFTFDRVFSASHNQAAVFEEVSNLVQSALDGYHVCLFSYGQTGSGKTHTMQGDTTGEQRGIIPRAVEKVMECARKLEEQGWKYEMEASFIEVYNEKIKDLLCKKANKGNDIALKHDSQGRVTLHGNERLPVKEGGDIVNIMELAHQNRSVAATKMNERSSRSHCIFTLHLVGLNSSTDTRITSSLNLCDLAGSERLSRSAAEGDRLKETQSINKSLSSLSDVFYSLSQKSSHVPYRNSKLTHVLQNCFTGDGKTLMFVNLSPTSESSQESLCSLRFSAKVHSVDLGKPKKNVAKSSDTTRAPSKGKLNSTGRSKELGRSRTQGGPDKKKPRLRK